jgi:site-specific recombinase XerD
MYQEFVVKLQEMLELRGLTESTIRSYTSYTQVYLDYLETILCKKPSEVTWDELRRYIHYLSNIKNLSARTINSIIAILQFFTVYVLHKPWDPYQLPKRKFDRTLPFVPSKEETWSFISTIPNLKYRSMIALMYSSGLRVNELCNLKCEDILSKQGMLVRIRKSKNRSEGTTQLSEKALELLREYWCSFGKPRDWLFPHPNDPSKPITRYYVLKAIREHEDRLGLEHKLNCHSFRHAAGTHLYQNGNDILTIKEFLRHKSLSSTLIYVTLSSSIFSDLKNPFDLLGLSYE